MDKPRHPNVIRTWVLNRAQAQRRPPQPAKFPKQRNAPNAPHQARKT